VTTGRYVNYLGVYTSSRTKKVDEGVSNNMNTRQTIRNKSETNMENNNKERFIHVYHVDLDNMLSDNESEDVD